MAIGPGEPPQWIVDAVHAGGGQVVALSDQPEGLVWADPRNLEELRHALDVAAHLPWVQLPWAGIEPLVAALDHDRVWTCGKGVYAEPVAELAVGLAVAGLRGVSHYARASQWLPPQGRNLLGCNVTVIGGGGITESLLRLLQPFGCRVTVVRQHVQSMDGAAAVIEADRFVDALPGADVVVLALALTPDTEGLIGANELAMMESHAWLINVARGRHIVTDDLVRALGDGLIGGAGLDVTDPEPLPDDHPLWSMPNCIITPHVGNTPEMGRVLLAQRITENVRRFAEGELLLGVVDVHLGY
jgi:phosphoglycerate dehydrogenase-like enzyme